MTARSQDLLREALALPWKSALMSPPELLASLDEPNPADEAAVQAAWAREIERRARRALSGESKGEPWEDVRGRIARNLAKR